MKHLLIGLLFFASALAQQTAQIREIKVPYMSVGELSATVLPVGTMAFSEGDPTKLYIGDGATPGGRRVSEPTPPWNHSATTNISLNGNFLNLGSGFVLHQLGGFAAVSGQGQIVAAPGVSTWGDSFTPFIQITGGNTLGQITGFTWNPIAALFTATILDADAGAPSIQWTNNLVTGVWASHTATVTGPSAGSYTATFAIPAGQTTAFFRATYPTGSTGKIELLNTTEITGSLTVSAGITGSLSVTNLTGKVTSAQIADTVVADIANGVTAHGWGNHATAGYLTALPATVSQAEAEAGTVTATRTWTPERVKQAILALSPPQPRVVDYALGFFPQPVANDLDWMLISRAVQITSADPGVAYARTAATAETVFTLQKNGASIGSVTFTPAGGTVALTADVTFAAGDRLELLAGATPNATLADIQVIIKGTLQ
jgi:hypothetical protein